MIRLAAFAVLVGLASLAHAEVIELEGTIKSVDASKREITIGRKTLDVAKKCRITIDGKELGIEDLKQDQEATVEYDSELEVAKSITVGEDAAADEAVARDMKALQGEWEAVEAEFNGEPLDRIGVRKLNRLIRIKGNSFHEEKLLNGKTVGVDGKFEINPKTKAFDFVGKVTGSNNAFEYVGIYEFDGDKLKLCCRANTDGNATRPKQFKSDSQKPNWSHYYVYKRLEE
jgi:uncharacterized protein (TIGR03067 family)